MGLTLTTLRCPEQAAPESRHASGGEFSIGRGHDNDWVLPDPERHLSKRHCVLAYRSGQWQVADTSSNGTFLNRETTPLGSGKPRPVRSGDRLRFGSYEIELTVAEDEAAPRASRLPLRANATPRQDLTPAMLDPFADESAPTPAWGERDPLLRDPGSAAPSALLPADFDPLHDDDDPFHEPFRVPTQSDHSPSINDAFRAPPAPAAAIPDDWDLDLPSLAPAPVRAAAPPPLPPVAPRPAAPPAAPQPPPVGAPADAALLAAFLRGTGLADAAPPDPERTMQAVGEALREMVAGIRQTLIARAAIKGEFRIEQTMVRASGNNPLKFSAGDDDAMQALLGIGRRGAMPAGQAVAEALRDMRLHELATVAAMQAAVRALLAQFDPVGIDKTLRAAAFDKAPGQRKARAWDAFTAMHGAVSRALSDDFDSVFGKAFARAYEQALREAGDEEDRP